MFDKFFESLSFAKVCKLYDVFLNGLSKKSKEDFFSQNEKIIIELKKIIQKENIKLNNLEQNIENIVFNKKIDKLNFSILFKEVAFQTNLFLNGKDLDFTNYFSQIKKIKTEGFKEKETVFNDFFVVLQQHMADLLLLKKSVTDLNKKEQEAFDIYFENKEVFYNKYKEKIAINECNVQDEELFVLVLNLCLIKKDEMLLSKLKTEMQNLKEDKHNIFMNKKWWYIQSLPPFLKEFLV